MIELKGRDTDREVEPISGQLHSCTDCCEEFWYAPEDECVRRVRQWRVGTESRYICAGPFWIMTYTSSWCKEPCLTLMNYFLIMFHGGVTAPYKPAG